MVKAVVCKCCGVLISRRAVVGPKWICPVCDSNNRMTEKEFNDL